LPKSRCDLAILEVVILFLHVLAFCSCSTSHRKEIRN
jgi:hypothetical protein